jgi:SAM-dependent methyltransferase
VVDLGCGHGRHAALLAQAGLRAVGLERDGASLALRPAGLPVVRGDFRQLPFGDGALAGAYAWYSTLFIHSDSQNAATLREVGRVLRPGARLVIHTVPFERMARAPEARFETTLPDGTHVVEQSRFDASTGVDTGQREMVLPDGRVLSGR